MALSAETYVSPSCVANIHVGLNDGPAALEWLEKAFQERSGALVYMHLDPQLDRLREHPGFQQLQERVGPPR